MRYWVGIDGGGTHTTAVVLDDTGAIAARVEGGAALIDPVHPLAGVEALGAMVQDAMKAAGAKSRDRAAGVCCALAGAGRVSVQESVSAELVRLAIARKVHVISDAEAALRDAFGDGPGALLIAGTGSVAWARSADGRMARAGGWGMLLGDEGSGYAIGMEILRAVVRAMDGRARKTSLTKAVLAATGVAAVGDLIAWTAAADKAGIAALAPLAGAAAAADDQPAIRIVTQAASDLALQVKAALGGSGPWSVAVPIAFSGGLVAPGRTMREPVWKALQALPYSFTLRAEDIDAARGAALIAQSRE